MDDHEFEAMVESIATEKHAIAHALAHGLRRFQDISRPECYCLVTPSARPDAGGLWQVTQCDQEGPSGHSYAPGPGERGEHSERGWQAMAAEVWMQGYHAPLRTLTLLTRASIPEGHPLMVMVTRRRLAAEVAALPDGATVATDSSEVLDALAATFRVATVRNERGEWPGQRWERLRALTGVDPRGRDADALHPSLDVWPR